MDNRAGEMQVFQRVVETGSFSEAARLLRMTPSTVSKLISRIEARLGVRLLERSTRHLSLTAEGQVYYERSRVLLAGLEDIERELSHGAASTGGTVRVSASVGFGIFGVEPLLPAFWHAYPNITVDLSLSDEIVDLYLDRTDVAFRVGPLSDSGMTARKLGVAQRKIVAAPGYLARRGAPAEIADLAGSQLPWLQLSPRRPGLAPAGQRADRRPQRDRADDRQQRRDGAAHGLGRGRPCKDRRVPRARGSARRAAGRGAGRCRRGRYRGYPRPVSGGREHSPSRPGVSGFHDAPPAGFSDAG
nr:LysR family transcriptional regulator [Sinirhodobacter populi]